LETGGWFFPTPILFFASRALSIRRRIGDCDGHVLNVASDGQRHLCKSGRFFIHADSKII
jgi:hypothetical protein